MYMMLDCNAIYPTHSNDVVSSTDRDSRSSQSSTSPETSCSLAVTQRAMGGAQALKRIPPINSPHRHPKRSWHLTHGS
ncbi:hypothetical protein Patl1_33461 [Pistacia atlantica]|uniref:Uncharacterized protein n=1 Tax=Pistacia atlantica TaxID=434234 RepID=A0ACC0ZSS4_9ROSI|nr:hypothetical protein Patl1_33461 [Pistacia atlantica]